MISYLISLTLLAGAVMLLRAIFKKNVSSKVIYALWLAVVLRLCLPFDFILLDIPSLGKLDNVTMGTIQLQTAEESTPVLAETSPEYATPVQTGNTVPAPAPVIPDTPSVDTPHGDAVISPETVAGESTPSPVPSVPTPEVSTESVPEGRSISVGRILDLVWFGGAAAVFTVFAASWLVFNGKLQKGRRYYGNCGKIKIYVTDKISSPCVAGIVPKIYITPELEESEHLPVILLHERAHLAQGDHIWSFVRVLAVSVYWWNPVIWAAAMLSKRDAELACDERVAKTFDSRERLEYARLLVDMTPTKKNYATSFAGGPIKERVMKLTREHKNKLIIAAVAVVLVIGCICAAFIGARDDSADIPATSDTATETPETTEDAETTDAPESSKDPYSDPVGVYGMFEVYEATENNRNLYSWAKEYDLSTGEHTFSLILVATDDISDIKFTRLIWNDELLLEDEETVKLAGDLYKRKAILLTVDSVEIIGYTGLSYTVDGKTVRYFPATSGMDGSAYLAQITEDMMSEDMLHPVLPAEVKRDHLEKAETDVRYKWITSFIGKDIDGCAEVLAFNGKLDAFDDYKKLMAPLEELYFRYYEVTDIEEEYPGDADRLLFKFYVERSNYDVYPVGYYEAELSVGGIDSFGCYLKKRPELPVSGNVTEYEKELDFASYFIALCGNVSFPEDPYSDAGGWWNMTENLLLIYEKANGITDPYDVRITKAELIELAYELYGIENYQLDPGGYTESAEGYCSRGGHGGTIVKTDIIRVNEENGVVSIDVRYYGDVTRFGVAHEVRYSIERTDSPYGFRLVKIEKIVDNGVSHWVRSV